MGSPENEAGRDDDERQHRVRITRRFGIGKDPVTQSQYDEVMGTNPSYFQHAGPDAPVEQVSWEDAMEFCRRLTELDRQSGKLPEGYEYTLPTEAQWEYACRRAASRRRMRATCRSSANATRRCSIRSPGTAATAAWTYEGGWDSSGWPRSNTIISGGYASGRPEAAECGGLARYVGKRVGMVRGLVRRLRRGRRGRPVGAGRGLVPGGPGRCVGRQRAVLPLRMPQQVDPGGRYRYLGFRVAAVQSAELQAREREGRPRGAS